MNTVFSETKTVLLVDDDVLLRSMVSRGIRREGVTTVEADNGHAARELIAADTDFDLIILDLQMPVMGGIPFLQWLRQDRQSTIPVLVYTGHTNEEAIVAARDAGASQIVNKPLNLEMFFQQVCQLLELP